MTEKQEQEATKLRNIMVQAIHTMPIPDHMPPTVAALFREVVGVREGSMTRHLIDHFADVIAKEYVKD